MNIIDLFCSLVAIDSESGDEGRFIEHLAGVIERELGGDAKTDPYGTPTR